MTEQEILGASYAYTKASLEGAGAIKGDKGDKGDPGVGVPTGGTAGQTLVKKSNTDYDTEWKDIKFSGKYNVLDYGLKADGTTDNSVAFSNMLSEVPTGGVVYFPRGKYKFTSPIVIEKTSIAIIGDTEMTHPIQSGVSSNLPLSVLIYDGDANTTFLSGGSNNWYLTLNNLHFDCVNGFDVAKNSADFTELPYPFLTYTTTKAGINGVDSVNRSGVDVSHCAFRGFSGVALKLGVHHIVRDNTFNRCAIGIEAGYDTIIQNSYFNMCQLCVNVLPNDNSAYSFTTLNISDTWADQCETAIKMTAYTSRLITSNLWCSMFDKAAIICTGRLNNSKIEANITRAGMLYAGIADADRTTALATSTDMIVADAILNSQINLAGEKRNIGQGKNSNGICPSRMVTATSGVIEGCEITNLSIDYTDIVDVNMVSSDTYTTIRARDNTIGVPTGGTTGQVLTKKSGSDYDTEWSDASGGGSDNPYKNKNVVHMGDSWVHIYGIAEDAADKVGYNVTVCGFQGTAISDYNTVFSDALEFSLIRLAKALGNNDWSAQDAAIAGSDPRAYGQPLARLKAVDWSNTDVLVLSYGVNDFSAYNPLGDEFARDEESVCGALISAINILQSLNSSMEIIVTTPCLRYIPSDNSTMVNLTYPFNSIDKYRRAIAFSAKKCAVKVIDMFAISGINEGNHDVTLLSDGLHPTALGVDKWGTAFANCIESGYVGAIDTNNTFTFGVDNLCLDSEKLDVHEKWNGSYTSGGTKYLCTSGNQQYRNCVLGLVHFDSLPVGTVIKLEGYGKKIGDTSHRLSFLILDSTKTNTLLDKYTTAISSTSDSAISYTFTTTEAYTDCWVEFITKNMSKWDNGKALVRDMKCTVTLPS